MNLPGARIIKEHHPGDLVVEFTNDPGTHWRARLHKKRNGLLSLTRVTP